MTWTPRIIRDGASRIDWNRSLAVFRKPRTARVQDDLTQLPYVTAKYDGLRVLCGFRRSSSEFAVLTTRPTDLAKIYPSHCLWRELCLKFFDYDDEVMIDGELIVPGKGREAVKTALAQGDPALSFVGFASSDCWLDTTAADALLWFKRFDIPICKWCRNDFAARELERIVRTPGYDGLIYKDRMYGTWLRVKNQRTVDCVVTAIRPGTGQFWGAVGAVEVAVFKSDNKLRKIGWANVPKHEDRRSITHLDLGRVCEVKYERLGSGGRLQSPIFQFFRDDKLGCDCTEDQLL